MVDDVVLNKAAVIERCVARVREEYAGDPRRLRDDITRQDSIILNLQRACEAAIDLAMHVVRVRRLGVPQETRESFEMDARDGERLEHAGARRLAKVTTGPAPVRRDPRGDDARAGS